MFHFPRFAPPSLWIQLGVRRPPWVSPFGHRRIKAWLAAPRRFSQLPTSFFASCRLGIHRVPFVAWSCVSSGAPLSRAAPPSDPRRPGSSAAPVVNRNPYSTTTLLLRACAYSVVKERRDICVVGLGRFELPTPRLSSVCSNQLSYRPDCVPVKDRCSVSQNQTASPLIADPFDLVAAPSVAGRRSSLERR